MIKVEDIHFKQTPNVYGPREDSWLLAKAVQEYAPTFFGKRLIKKAMDMGCGSGIQTAALLLSGAEEVLCVDIEPAAINATMQMVSNYFPTANVKSIQGNLFENVKGKFDMIVFNPPYVPSEEIKWREVDGGKKGREIIDAFLDALPEHLTHKGMCLLLQTSFNSLYLTRKKCAEKKLKIRIVARQKIPFEELQILKITLL